MFVKIFSLRGLIYTSIWIKILLAEGVLFHFFNLKTLELIFEFYQLAKSEFFSKSIANHDHLLINTQSSNHPQMNHIIWFILYDRAVLKYDCVHTVPTRQRRLVAQLTVITKAALQSLQDFDWMKQQKYYIADSVYKSRSAKNSGRLFEIF